LADTVSITAGSGTSISTEEVTTLNGSAVTAQHVQRTATAIRTADGTAIDLPGDSSNGLDVDVTRVGGTVTIAGAVTNAGTFAVQESGSALTALQLIDDSVYVDDADWTDNTSKHLLVGGVYQSSPHTVTDGDVSPFLTDANGRLVVAATDNGGTLSIDDGAGSITIDGTVAISGTVTVGSHAVTNAGTFAVQVDGTALTRLTDIETNTDSGAVVGNGAAATAQRVTLANDSTGIVALTTSTASIGKLAANSGVDIGDVDVTSVPSDPFGANADAASATGSISAKLRFIAATGIPVTSIAAGNNNIGDVDVASLPNVTLAAGTNTNEVVGDAAHGAAVAGNPLLAGLEGRSTAPTAVSDGQVVRALATTLGKQVTYPFALPANSWSYASPAAVTDTADDEAKAAVASTRNYITGVQVFNGHDSTGTEVVIKDGSTVLWRGWAEQTGGGCSAVFNPPLRGTANTAVNVANITNSSSTYFNLQGFVAAE
jgi:hypothetical protein